MKRLFLTALAAASFANAAYATEDLVQGFVRPPQSARPWVYWFPLDGNLSREGITADLEAMQRVGIGGVIYMETAVGTPTGPVSFAGPVWREMIRHACTEAHRLGLEINVNNDAGWSGSGGPWITPELSMQKISVSETPAEGPRRFDGVLPQPESVCNFYRDIALLAFPTPTGPKAHHRIDRLQGKASFIVEQVPPLPAAFPALPAEAVIPRGRIVDLSAKMDARGRLVWDVPAGKWTLFRIGYTTTGQTNRPAPKSGLGLECDKLSKRGIEAHFAGLMGKLITDNGPLVSKTLVRTHIDSWEVKSQNWTPQMREEFRRLRGYDPLLLLPAMTGRIVDNLEVSERFLGDLRQTVSDLIVENYAGHMRTLANRNGLQLSIEAYGEPADDIAYAGRADEPMGEFWSSDFKFSSAESCTEMVSAAHVYGKRIIGAEAFTSCDGEKWLGHPGNIKDLGDWAFCEGINRFVFHRYTMQPWLNVRPGMSMGPFGLHYERTQTWWEQSRAWHQYLARCQFLLRQGLFVADICYLQPEGAPREFVPPPRNGPPHTRPGYNFDGCTAEVVLTRMTVRNGRLVLPDGMSYRVLVLPDVETMTPALLRKVKGLIEAGATVVGGRVPRKSPSLTDYPACDAEVQQLAELWQGKIVTDKTAEQLLAARGVKPDFAATAWLRYIHRVVGDVDVYFVSNPEPRTVEAVATFRINGKQPELWRPDTGRIEPVAAFLQEAGCTRVPLRLDPSGSVFVVFRRPVGQFDPIVTATRDGQSILPRSTDAGSASPPVAEVHANTAGTLVLEAWQPGRYDLKTAAGKTLHAKAAGIPPSIGLTGPWEVTFPAGNGAPPQATFNKLLSWSEHADRGIKYFSGTATYRKTFNLPDEQPGKDHRVYLDLGEVAVMAEVNLNGHDLGILWKRPYRADATDAIRSGKNVLEVKVVNLWANRLIGDEQLPDDSPRADGQTVQQWPQWLLEGKPSPTGRYTFTSHRLWKKDDPLLPSGLLGPVTLQTTQCVPVK